MPEITVLMPVRNGERYIKESIDSVLNQTLTDFEFLIIDDGSTDRTVEIIQGYTDKRIRLVRKEHQFIQNLNEGFPLLASLWILWGKFQKEETSVNKNRQPSNRNLIAA